MKIPRVPPLSVAVLIVLVAIGYLLFGCSEPTEPTKPSAINLNGIWKYSIAKNNFLQAISGTVHISQFSDKVLIEFDEQVKHLSNATFSGQIFHDSLFVGWRNRLSYYSMSSQVSPNKTVISGEIRFRVIDPKRTVNVIAVHIPPTKIKFERGR